MKRGYKILILLEAIIGFGPLILMLGMGLIFIPSSIYWALEGQYFGLVLLAIEVAGLLGLFAFISVLLHILEPNRIFLSPKKLRIYTFLGFSALLAFISVSDVKSEITWLPISIIVSLHFMYLARNYLFIDK